MSRHRELSKSRHSAALSLCMAIKPAGDLSNTFAENGYRGLTWLNLDGIDSKLSAFDHELVWLP